MRYGPWTRVTFAATTLMAAACATAQPEPAGAAGAAGAAATSAPSVDLRVGWSLLKEGSAEGQVEQDAKHPANDKPHLLRIEVTRRPGPGEGRAGATNDIGLNVEAGRWYDVTFAGVPERGSVGLVFSLESADGRVLARTTLAGVGRVSRRPPGPGGGPATRPASASTTGPAATAEPAPPAPGTPPPPAVPRWNNYLVSLHARGSDPGARLVIHPVEPTNVWLEGLTLTPRPARADEARPGGDPSQQRKEQR